MINYQHGPTVFERGHNNLQQMSKMQQVFGVSDLKYGGGISTDAVDPLVKQLLQAKSKVTMLCGIEDKHGYRVIAQSADGKHRMNFELFPGDALFLVRSHSTAGAPFSHCGLEDELSTNASHGKGGIPDQSLHSSLPMLSAGPFEQVALLEPVTKRHSKHELIKNHNQLLPSGL